MGGWIWWPVVLGCERETQRRERERERERGKIKKRIKNDKEIIFKGSVKKIRSFDIRKIVKWCVICYKIRF